MGSVDSQYAAEEERKQVKEMALRRFHQRQREQANSVGATGTLSDSSTYSSDTEASPEKFPRPRHSKTPKRARLSGNVIDVNLAATWDRERISVRKAAMTFAATAPCLGLESSDVPSKSTVHRRRKDSRAQAGLQFREQMAGLPPGLVLHWDGKLLPDTSGGSDTVDRIAVVVTGEGVEQLLGVPKAVDGSGREMASVVRSAITSLEIADKIIGLSFDITASNTGMLKGACMRLEEALGKNLLWLTF